MKRLFRKKTKGSSKQGCSTGKTRYFSHKAARVGITMMWGNDPHIKIEDFHTYQCPTCRAVHIGHRIPRGLRENQVSAQ